MASSFALQQITGKQHRSTTFKFSVAERSVAYWKCFAIAHTRSIKRVAMETTFNQSDALSDLRARPRDRFWRRIRCRYGSSGQ